LKRPISTGIDGYDGHHALAAVTGISDDTVMKRNVATKAVTALVVVGLVAGGGFLFLAGGDLQFESPAAESVESEFGTTSADRTELRTAVVVDNPSDRVHHARGTRDEFALWRGRGVLHDGGDRRARR
jgi:hypothetical protein